MCHLNLNKQSKNNSICTTVRFTEQHELLCPLKPLKDACLLKKSL